MGLIDTSEYLHETLPLDKEAASQVFGRVVGEHLLAEDDVRAVVGDGFYEEVEADTSHAARRRMAAAESLFAFAHALPNLNLRITDRGGLVTATGFDASRQELMSEGQVRRLQEQYRRKARRLLSQYALPKTPYFHI